MSKYIERIPLSRVERIAVVFGGGRSMAQCKGDADYIMNAGFYNMSNGKPVGHLKTDGTVHAKEDWSCWGYAWNTGSDMEMTILPDDVRSNYLDGVSLLTPWDSVGSKLSYIAEVSGSRPRTAIALDGETLILYCADTPATPEKLRDELYAMGADTAMMLDGGGSTQCDFQGKKITSSRRVHNYLAVWLKKESQDSGKEETDVARNVVLDPGHGVETAGKCAPDKSYYEHEFNLDVAKRIKAILERHGVNVVMTRTTEHEPCPNANAAKMESDSLAKRVEVSNTVGPDLFVSIHSNASGNGLDWTTTAGYGIYTSQAGDSAQRNKAARAILTRAKEVGVSLWGDGLFHELFYVLRNTVAPAVLIEHGFHTNQAEVELLKSDAYRDKLAGVDAKGILDYLGITWVEDSAEKTQNSCICPHCGNKLKIEKG